MTSELLLMRTSSNDESHTDLPPKLNQSMWDGWRFPLFLGLLVSIITLVCNIVLAGLGYHNTYTGLFSGDCDTAESIDTWSHLVINVLAALLLNASNTAMQSVSAPTREDIDRLHACNKAADIGIMSVRNWTTMSKKRRALWVLFGLTSLPLHLFYNSVIISSFQYVNWVGVAVPESFLIYEASGLPFRPEVPGIGVFLEEAQSQAIYTPKTMVNLTAPECVEHLKPTLATEYRAIFFVSKSYQNMPNNNFTNSTFIPQLYIRHDCSMSEDTVIITDPHDPMNLSSGFSLDHDDWIEDWEHSPSTLNTGNWYNNGNWSGLHIDYCFAQPIAQDCSVGVVYPFLALVIFMNVVKIVCLLFFLRAEETSAPLGTLGDAIASLLNNPDSTTAKKPLIDLAKTPRKASTSWIYSKLSNGVTKSRDKNRRSWYHGASRRRWIITLICCFAFQITMVTLWVHFAVSHSISNVWSKMFNHQALGGPFSVGDSTPALSISPGYYQGVMISNSFQIMLSIVFFCFSGLFSSMLLTREFSRLSIKRQGLRVSYPRGDQRRAYQLRMPFRYAVPLIGVSAVLHWMLSEAIFFENFQILDPVANIFSYDTASQGIVICNMLPLFVLNIVWIAVMAFVGIFVKAKKLPSGVPILRTNSIAISTACHPVKSARNEGYKRLKWGLIRNGDHHTLGLSSDQVEAADESLL